MFRQRLRLQLPKNHMIVYMFANNVHDHDMTTTPLHPAFQSESPLWLQDGTRQAAMWLHPPRPLKRADQLACAILERHNA